MSGAVWPDIPDGERGLRWTFRMADAVVLDMPGWRTWFYAPDIPDGGRGLCSTCPDGGRGFMRPTFRMAAVVLGPTSPDSGRDFAVGKRMRGPALAPSSLMAARFWRSAAPDARRGFCARTARCP
jgi:hypothetical protein